MRLSRNWALFLLVVALVACKGQAMKAKPGWISNPGEGAVGSSKTHVKGRYYQEELAIARARERLAARYGVDVSSVQAVKEKVINDKAYVRSEKEILQTVKNTTVKAHVREVWHDVDQDELWVWVYPVAP